MMQFARALAKLNLKQVFCYLVRFPSPDMKWSGLSSSTLSLDVISFEKGVTWVNHSCTLRLQSSDMLSCFVLLAASFSILVAGPCD